MRAEIGWEIVPQSEAVGLRKGEGGMFFYNLLEETLLRLNPGVITPENVDDVIRRLEGVRNSSRGTRRFWPGCAVSGRCMSRARNGSGRCD